MSKFFKALEQAERDRALQQGGAPKPTATPASSPQVKPVEPVVFQAPPVHVIKPFLTQAPERPPPAL